MGVGGRRWGRGDGVGSPSLIYAPKIFCNIHRHLQNFATLTGIFLQKCETMRQCHLTPLFTTIGLSHTPKNIVSHETI